MEHTGRRWGVRRGRPGYLFPGPTCFQIARVWLLYHQRPQLLSNAFSIQPLCLDSSNQLYFRPRSGKAEQASLYSVQFSSVQSLSRVWLFATPWIAACQASLSITNFRSSPRLASIESVMPSSHLILCRPLLLLPPIPPRIRVFSNESTLPMRWPKYWSFSFSIIPSKEIPGLISFRMDCIKHPQSYRFECSIRADMCGSTVIDYWWLPPVMLYWRLAHGL